MIHFQLRLKKGYLGKQFETGYMATIMHIVQVMEIPDVMLEVVEIKNLFSINWEGSDSSTRGYLVIYCSEGRKMQEIIRFLKEEDFGLAVVPNGKYNHMIPAHEMMDPGPLVDERV